MSMVRIVFIFAWLWASALPAFAWNTVRTNFDLVERCSAVSPFSSPRDGVFAVQAERERDGIVRQSITLKLEGGAWEAGRAQLGLLLDGQLYGPFEVSVKTGFGAVQYELSYPTRWLIEQLKGAQTATLLIDGTVAVVRMSLAGSRRALTEWDACVAELAAPDQDELEEWGEEAQPGAAATPSFDCGATLSPVEAMICSDDELASMDHALAPLFASARELARDWVFVGDGPRRTALDCFDKNAREDLAWREGVCVGKRECVEAWFIKRHAMMTHFASKGFGDSGVRSVRQLPGNDTIISISMATHVRNTLYDATKQEFVMMPSGDISILNGDPLFYRVDGQKGSWMAGGAFWVSTIRDDQHRIVSMATPADSAGCMSKSEFIAKSNFTLNDLARVPDDTICYASTGLH